MSLKPRKDRIDSNAEKMDLFLPIGHFSIFKINNESQNNSHSIVIHGLGSCVALILYDLKNNVGGISHILLPNSRGKDAEYPHKYANLAVPDLIKEIIKFGGNRQNLKAIILGGSNIFDDPNNLIGTENSEKIVKELEDFSIPIFRKDIGGKLGRVVILNTKNLHVLVKKTGEDNFEKLM